MPKMLKKETFKCRACRLVFAQTHFQMMGELDVRCPACGGFSCAPHSKAGTWVIWILVLLTIAIGAWYFWGR
jgi:hypothetical protein